MPRIRYAAGSIACLVCLAAGTLAGPLAAEDAIPMNEVLARIASDASRFWGAAPDYVARETWRQKTTIAPSAFVRLQLSEDSPKPPEPREVVHEIVSLYTLGAYHKSPESLWEFRRTLSIDGKKTGDPAAERLEFLDGLRGKDDRWRHKLRERFEKQGRGGWILDFGQILLLFTRPRQQQYTFQFAGAERIGADNALRIGFAQQLGEQSVRVHDRGKDSSAPLTGEILVREPGFGVLEVRLRAEHMHEGHPVRDETTVDYTEVASGVLLPVSIVHKHFVDGKASTEDLLEYSDWENIRGAQ